MSTLKLKVKSDLRGRRFDRAMDFLLSYCDHLGIIMGGGWSAEEGTAEFYPYAHGINCCNRVPPLAKVTAPLKEKVSAFAAKKGLILIWGR